MVQIIAPSFEQEQSLFLVSCLVFGFLVPSKVLFSFTPSSIIALLGMTLKKEKERKMLKIKCRSQFLLEMLHYIYLNFHLILFWKLKNNDKSDNFKYWKFWLNNWNEVNFFGCRSCQKGDKVYHWYTLRTYFWFGISSSSLKLNVNKISQENFNF